MFDLTGKNSQTCINKEKIKRTDAAAQCTFLRYAGFKWILLNKAPGSISDFTQMIFQQRRAMALSFSLAGNIKVFYDFI